MSEERAVEALVRTLDEDAAAVEPSDRLAELRVRARRGARRRPLLAAACAAVVAGGTALGAGLVARDPGPTPPAGPTGATDLPTTAPAPSPSAPSVTATPSGPPSGPSATTPASTAPSSGAASAHVLPVYYLGRDGNRWALFREFHRHDVADDGALAAAVRDATDSTSPDDGDLVAPWRPGTTGAKVSGPRDGVVTVDLPATEGEAHGRTAEQARLAAQQLVWTVTAVQQDAGLGVRVLLDGRAGRLFGAVPVGDVVHRTSPSYEVLGSVWVEAPDEDQQVSGRVTVRGSACTFEAAVGWQLLRDGQVVRSGSTTASSGCPVRGTWTVQLAPLPPGRYVFRAFESPASGQGPDREQTRTFVVR